MPWAGGPGDRRQPRHRPGHCTPACDGGSCNRAGCPRCRWRAARPFACRDGTIVNISAGVAEPTHARAGGAAYGGTKAMFDQMTRCLALELQGTGVVANALAPQGASRTEFVNVRGPDSGRIAPGIPGSAVVAVQVSDVQSTPNLDVRYETLHQRLIPGEGVGGLPQLLRSLRDQGCTAPMEVEVYSDTLTAIDPVEAAQRCAEGLRGVLTQAGCV